MKAKNINIWILVILFLTTISAHFVHHKNYNSYKQQVKIFRDINSSNYSNTSPEFYNNLEINIPNLSVTSIPIKAVKGIYIQVNEPLDSIEKAKNLLHKSIKDNPFLMYSEGNLSEMYFALRNYDSAYYYARKSFLGLPKNAIHFAMMGKLYANKGHYDSIVFAFNKINSPPRADITKIFLASMVNFYNKIDDSLKNSVMKIAKSAKNRYLDKNELQTLADYVIKGKKLVDNALDYQEKGQKLLFEKNYNEGIELYKKALEIRDGNISIIQTIGLAYYNIREYRKVIDYMEQIEKVNVKLDPLSLYITGMSYHFLREPQKSCQYLLKSKKFKNKQASDAYDVLCIKQ